MMARRDCCPTTCSKCARTHTSENPNLNQRRDDDKIKSNLWNCCRYYPTMMKAKQGRFSFSAGRYTRNDGKAANSKRRLVLVYWAVVVASFVASLVLLVRTDLRLPSVYKTDNYNYNGADDNHNNNAMHMHIVLPASNNSNSNSYDDGDNSMDAAEEEEKTTKEEETETEEEADVPVDGNSTSEQKQKQQQQQQPVLPAPTAKIVTVSLKVSNHNWDRIRYVCGKAIRPNGIVVVNATVDLQATDVNADPSSLSTTTTTAASASDFYNNHNHNCVASLDESTGTFGVFSSTRVFPYDPPLRKTKKKSENHHNNNHNNYTQPGVIFRYNRKVDVPVSLDSYEAVRGCDIPCVRCGDFSSSSSSSGTTGGSGGVIGGWVTVEDTPFVIRAMSMEGPGYYPSLIVDHRAHWKHQYYATTALQESDVPIAYYNVGRNDNDDLRSTPPVDFDDGIRGASFLARNCRSLNHREDLVRDLIRDAATISSNNQTQSPPFLFRIDSLSSCVHYAPHGFPNGTSQASSKRDILKRYLFHLAFENHNADDYVTEKLWSTLESGTIPVYFGAPNIIRGNDSNGNNGNGNNNQLLPHPHRSIIDVSDFVVDASKEDGKERRHHGINTTALVEYIWTVATNRTLYYSYHAWRTKWWENNRNNNNNNNNSNSNSNSNSNDDTNTTIEEYYRRFLDTWEFTRTGLNCRICRFFYALRYGWGWDHRRQELRELHPLPADDDDDDEFGDFVRREIQPTGYNRTTCFLEHNGRMVFPMQEFWATDDGDYNADGHNNEVRREIRCTSSGGGDGDGSQKWHRRMVTAKGGGDDEFLRTIRDHDGVTDMVLVRQQTTKHRSTAGAAGAGATSSEEEDAVAMNTAEHSSGIGGRILHGDVADDWNDGGITVFWCIVAGFDRNVAVLDNEALHRIEALLVHQTPSDG